MLHIYLFDRVAIQHSGKPEFDQWPRRKTKLLLARLVAERGQVFSRESLCDLLFPDASETSARRSLRGRISELRHLLEPNLKRGQDSTYIIQPNRGQYAFNIDAKCRVDVDLLHQSNQSVQQQMNKAQWQAALKQGQPGLELYRGEFLADEVYEDWAVPLRQFWMDQYRHLQIQCAACHFELEQYKQAIELLESACRPDQPEESLYQLLMKAHSKAGNRTKALSIYDQLKQHLSNTLGTTPEPETQAVYQQILSASDTAHNIHNLPKEPNEFVGRQQELQFLTQQLQDQACHWVTVLGTGGMGKSRLALILAKRCLEQFPDGVFWFPLAEIQPGQLINILCQTLPLERSNYGDLQDELIRWLSSKRLLLVLDNMEHLTEETSSLLQLLDHAPNLKIVMTSRQRFDVPNEWVYELQGLDYDTAQTEDDVPDAQQLLLKRAQRHRLVQMSDEGQGINRVCALTQGSPLGIELAVSWVPILSCEEIADGIENSLDFLSTSKGMTQYSLRGAFDHSYQLLSPEEQDFFQALTIFQSGFRHQAAKAVTGISLSTLMSLLNKSLIRRTETGRFELHTLLRQFGQELLSSKAARYGKLKVAHRDWYLNLLNEKMTTFQQARDRSFLTEVEEDLTNVLDAWKTAIETTHVTSLKQSEIHLFRFFIVCFRHQEGVEAFGNAIQRLDPLSKTKPRHRGLLAKLKTRQAAFLIQTRRYSEADELLLETVDQARHRRDTAEEAMCLNLLGFCLNNQGKYYQAMPLWEKLLKLSKSPKNQVMWIGAIDGLGLCALYLGDKDKAQSYFKTAKQHYEKINNITGIARCQGCLGLVSFSKGHYKRARRSFESALKVFEEVDDENNVLRSHLYLGEVALHCEEIDLAITEFEWVQIESHLLPDHELGARANILLAEIKIDQGDFDSAKILLDKALSNYSQLDNHFGLTMVHQQLGRWAYCQSEFELAQNHLRTSLEYAWPLRILPLVLNTLTDWAALFIKQENWTHASKILTTIDQHLAMEAITRKKTIVLRKQFLKAFVIENQTKALTMTALIKWLIRK